MENILVLSPMVDIPSFYTRDPRIVVFLLIKPAGGGGGMGWGGGRLANVFSLIVDPFSPSNEANDLSVFVSTEYVSLPFKPCQKCLCISQMYSVSSHDSIWMQIEQSGQFCRILRKTGSTISTSRIHDFNFTNSTSRIQLHEFTNSTSRIHDFNFTNSTSRIQLHEFTNSTSRILLHEFTNEVEFVNSWSWIREFVKLKSWIREVEIVNSWSWNREFVKLKSWIHEVETLN